MPYWVSQSGACLISLAFWVFRGIRVFSFTNIFRSSFSLSYGRSKNVFYLHSTVNRTFDINFCSIIIIKLRCKNYISSPTGASQQERDKDHFSVVSSSNKITIDNSLWLLYCMDFRCSGPSPPAWNIIPFFAMRDERPWPLCL